MGLRSIHRLPSQQRFVLGLGQVGRSFRNEITCKQFIFRTREFEQMELQYFCDPDESSDRSAIKIAATRCCFPTLCYLRRMHYCDPTFMESSCYHGIGRPSSFSNPRIHRCAEWTEECFDWLVHAVGLQPDHLRCRKHENEAHTFLSWD